MSERPTTGEQANAPDHEDEVPGTGIFEDETLVRDLDLDGDGIPGIYPGPPAHTGGEAEPGPARPEETEDG